VYQNEYQNDIVGCHDITEILLKVALNTINHQNEHIDWFINKEKINLPCITIDVYRSNFTLII
jgi:hypothetical protein